MPPIRQHTVVRDPFLILDEELLDRRGLVAQAENEVLMAPVGIGTSSGAKGPAAAQAVPAVSAGHSENYASLCPGRRKTALLSSLFALFHSQLFDYSRLGNWNHKSSAPAVHKRQLSHDLGLQVPRQDQHIVWSDFRNMLWRQNRNTRARQEATMLVRIAINGEINEISTESRSN